MKNKKKVNIGWIISGMFLLVLLISASFAYFGMFTVNLENKVAVNIHASTIGDTSFIATSANLNVIVPTSGMFKGNTGLAAENTATLTVNLTGAPDVITTCTYDVVYEYDLSSEIYGSTVAVTNGATKEITLEVSSPSGTNSYASETNFAYDSTWTPKTTTVGAKKTLVKNATITSEGTSVVQNINITGRYYNLEVDQAQLGNKSFTGKIYVENNNCTVGEVPKAKDIILAKNGGANAIETKGSPDFTAVATTNDGMYAAKDDQGTSYYFRGAVDNNWIKFGKYSSNGPVRGYYSASSSSYKKYTSLEECNSSSSYNYNCSYLWNIGDDIYWRIIRINGDGSVRMIYSGTTAPTEDQKVVMLNDNIYIGKSDFNTNVYKPEYVGYKYEIGKQHGLTNDSAIKTYIDNWYTTTSLYTDESTSKLIADSPFCYDRSASRSENGDYGEINPFTSNNEFIYYGAYGRLVANKKPVLTCPTASDKFTVGSSSGNGALTYPVGLITADEVAMAGAVSGSGKENRAFYLFYYTVEDTDGILIGSPDVANDEGAAMVFGLSFSFYEKTVNNEDSMILGVRPVISLSKDVKLSGDGTYNNPYVVES